jgi:molecular chaperone DnaK (HSP70)
VEPAAAARYYTRAGGLRPGSGIAVFDFGGGTVDIAVLAAEAEGGFYIAAFAAIVFIFLHAAKVPETIGNRS